MQCEPDTYDAVVIGGGPAGATAATDLARHGVRVALVDRAGRIKPCGGAVPPRAIRDFEIPEQLLVAKVRSARMVSPSEQRVDMPIDGGFVGMVDRKTFDPWLRQRAGHSGADLYAAAFEQLSRDDDGVARVHVRPTGGLCGESAEVHSFRARVVIGADGALSKVARQCVPGAERMPFVFAYHEIVAAPATRLDDYDPARCDVYYQGRLSPDFYGWVFPHGDTASVGVGSANKGFSLRSATAELRRASGLEGVATIRKEGAPIPLKPLRRWDNGRDVVLAGDAAGVVAPASGEGIYYAMLGGRLAADAALRFLETGNRRALGDARRSFMRAHGRVFLVLGLLQYFWYRNDRRRERFVTMCRDPDVQRLTWQAYMNKELVRRDPLAHLKVFMKDVGHLMGIVAPR